MKKILFVLLIASLLPFKSIAEWVPLKNQKAAGTPPGISILRDDNNGTVIKVELSGFDVKDFYTAGKKYQVIDLLTETYTTEPGSPELPYIAKILAIPDQAGISVEVLETGDEQVFKNITIAPARLSWWEGEPESPFTENSKAYQSGVIYPNEFVKADPPAVFRDFRIARISVFPVRYDAANKELHVVSSITIRVNYGTGDVVNPKTTARKAIAPSFGKLYRSFIFNYQTVLNNFYGGREDGRELILCIMPDEFTESFKIYAEWKRQSGTDVHVTKFTDIGANPFDPDIIKNHIANAYHNWDNPPTYVLLVGDEEVFPHKIVTYPDYSFPNEDYFVEIDGNDYFPEMMIGRFTNQGDYRMQVMLTKFMLYEKNPLTSDPTWFRKGTCCANNEYDSQVETKRFTYSKMMENGGFISVDTLMSDGDWWGGGDCTVDLDDIISAINNGRSFLNYRGEGWYDGWSAGCYSFNTYDVSELNNGQKFTFVTSIGCGVAGFQAGGGNCFGEEWVELGTITNPRGGVAFIGPTSNTHTTYNNKIDKGIYEGMFVEGMDTPGQALLRGKLYMYNVFGNAYYVEYHYKVYCILGDPSIHIWKDTPVQVNADYPSFIPVGDNDVEFTVTFAPLGQPVANAEVCVTGDEIFATGITDPNGIVVINITSAVEDTLTVTVRGGNVVPFQGSLEIIQYDVYVEPDGDPLIVDLDGNADGLINPNEHCNMTYTLKNWGIQTAVNVQATLSTEDTDYVEIINAGPVSYGNITPGGTSTGSPFQIYVKPGCPIDQLLTFQLHIVSETNSWDYYYDPQVMGCKLTYENYVIFDAGSPEMNFRMDPGENVVVVLSIKNIGHDIAPGVVGVLSSNDQFITITDSIGSFGTLDINDLSVDMENYFTVSVDPACPVGYFAEYSLRVYTQNGNYPYENILNFHIPVGMLTPNDYTGPDAYGYYAYSSDDSFYEQTPVYDWFEIETIGTQLPLPDVSDYTQTVNLPFTFKYYGVNYSQVRISTDGWIAFGSGTQTAPLNAQLPNNDNVNSMVAAFWDDLYDIEYFMGSIYYYNDAANHRFIIEWDSIARNIISAEPVKEYFQMILLDPEYYPTATGDGEIIVQYEKIEGAVSNTIGIENHTVDIGLQYVFNDEYDPTASVLVNEFAIKFTTEPPFTNIITGVADGQVPGNKPDPRDYGLFQNHPNPFISNTWIDYSLPGPANVTINIYDIRGAFVCALYNGQQSAGKYSVEWNGLNSAGAAVSAGVYFCRLQTENYSGTMKMFMLK
jgi:hypothetical protein